MENTNRYPPSYRTSSHVFTAPCLLLLYTIRSVFLCRIVFASHLFRAGTRLMTMRKEEGIYHIFFLWREGQRLLDFT
jgi:hypothetical protein